MSTCRRGYLPRGLGSRINMTHTGTDIYVQIQDTSCDIFFSVKSYLLELMLELHKSANIFE